MEANNWTVETLKESVDQRFADNQKAVETALLAQEKAVNTALLAAKEAVIKAEILTDKRFDSVNETVTQVTGQNANLLPRAEYVANHKALDDKIEVINNTMSKTSSERGLYATHADVAAAVEGITNTIKPIVEYINRQQGQASGSQITMGKIYATLGAFTAILGVLIYMASQISK